MGTHPPSIRSLVRMVTRELMIGQTWLDLHPNGVEKKNQIRKRGIFADRLTSRTKTTKGLFGFCFYFLYFLYSGFCEGNTKNRK